MARCVAKISIYLIIDLAPPVSNRGNMTKLQKFGLRFVAVFMLIAASASISIAGKSTNSVIKKNMNTDKSNAIEAISAVEFDGEKMTFGVLSFGCTNADDFVIEHKVSDNSCAITIVRTKPDLCRRAPFISTIEIEWSMPEDCIDFAMHIKNPILVTQAKGGVIKRMK